MISLATAIIIVHAPVGSIKFKMIMDFQISDTHLIEFCVITKFGPDQVESSCYSWKQGSHASWKVLDFFHKISTLGKSWKMNLVLESPGYFS